MREPFPELFHLELSLGDKFDVMVPVLPDSFLGGLQELFDSHPGLPKLLSSATLSLWDFPHSWYFSPEMMVTALSMLTSLTYFRLQRGQ